MKLNLDTEELLKDAKNKSNDVIQKSNSLSKNEISHSTSSQSLNFFSSELFKKYILRNFTANQLKDLNYDEKSQLNASHLSEINLDNYNSNSNLKNIVNNNSIGNGIFVKFIKQMQEYHSNNELFQLYINKILNSVENILEYSNIDFVNKVNNLDEHDKIQNIYCTRVNYIKNLVNEIIEILLKNVNYIPYSISILSNIIIKNYKAKNNKDFSILNMYAEFGNIIYTKLFESSFETLTKSIFDLQYLNDNCIYNFKIVSEILKKLFNLSLFKRKDSPHLTTFNEFLIEITPKILEFYEKIDLNLKLPEQIEDYFNKRNEQFEWKLIENHNKGNVFVYNTNIILIIISTITSNWEYFIKENKENDNQKLELTDMEQKLETLVNSLQETKTFNLLTYYKKERSLKGISMFEFVKYFFPKNLEEFFTTENHNHHKHINHKNEPLIYINKVKKFLFTFLTNQQTINETYIKTNNSNENNGIIETLSFLLDYPHLKIFSSKDKYFELKSLNLLLEKLPSEYKKDDYKLLFNEIYNELISINYNEIFNEIAYVQKNVDIIEHKVKEIKPLLTYIKNEYINELAENLITTFSIEASYEILSTEKGKCIRISYSNTQPKNKAIKLKNPQIKVSTIKELCEIFPSINQSTNRNFYSICNNLHIKQTLKDIFLIVKNLIISNQELLFSSNNNHSIYVPKTKSFVDELPEENNHILINDLYHKIIHYIMSQLYQSLYQSHNNLYEKNINFLNKISNYLQPYHFKIKKEILFLYDTTTSKKIMNYILNQKSPISFMIYLHTLIKFFSIGLGIKNKSFSVQIQLLNPFLFYLFYSNWNFELFLTKLDYILYFNEFIINDIYNSNFEINKKIVSNIINNLEEIKEKALSINTDIQINQKMTQEEFDKIFKTLLKI